MPSSGLFRRMYHDNQYDSIAELNFAASPSYNVKMPYPWGVNAFIRWFWLTKALLRPNFFSSTLPKTILIAFASPNIDKQVRAMRSSRVGPNSSQATTNNCVFRNSNGKSEIPNHYAFSVLEWFWPYSRLSGFIFFEMSAFVRSMEAQ